MLIYCLVISSFLIQLTTAFLALRLVIKTGKQLSWLFIAIAMVMQASRLIIVLIGLITGDIVPSQVVISECIGLAVSVLMFMGVTGLSSFLIKGKRIDNQRRKAESTLTESEEKYRYMFANNPQPMWIYDLETLAFLEVNDAAVNHYGYSRNEFLSMTLKDIRPQEDVEALLKDVEKTRKTYNPAGEWRHLKANGDLINVDIISHSLIFNNRKARHVMITDITEHKLVEDKIIKLNEELEIRVKERTSQLESANKELEAFSYSVSHDLRSPLRHINGFAEILITQYSDLLPSEARNHINTIIGSARKMGTLIDDLLSFSRTGRAELKKTSLKMNDVVDDAVSQLKPSFTGRKIKLNISTLPEIYGDYSLLLMAWVNMLDNALKYTRTTDKTVICIGHQEEKDELIFYIRDNGVGFDMRYAQKLFGVFQRLHTSSQFDGTGIGLANVRRIITRHGGRTWAEAETDKGATFYFSIPK